jgi:hypothetical protein
MSQTVKKETVLFLTEKTRGNPHPLTGKTATRAAIFSDHSHAFEAAR